MPLTKPQKIHDDYLALVRRFPLAPIRSRKQLNQAFAVLDELSVIDEDRLTPGQADYLLVLTDLVEKYESEHTAIGRAFVDGVDCLAYLMERSGLSASDIGRILGNRQLGSAILRRRREFSKSHILKLAEYFGVSTDLFLRASKVAMRRAS